MAKRKPNESTESFEQAIANLESLVEAMENEQLPLEELVAHYEKGTTLLQQCETLLDSARHRVELITLRAAAAAEPSSTPDADLDDDEPTGSKELTDSGADDLDDDDIRLF